MKKNQKKNRTVVFVNNLNPTCKRSPNGEMMNEIGSLYKFPRHHCLIFDFQYVISMLADFLTGPYPDADCLNQLIDRLNKGKPVTADILRKLLNQFEVLLSRPEFDVVLVDIFFVNEETLPKWINFFNFAKTNFVYLEVGTESTLKMQSLMTGFLIPSRRVQDSTKISSEARKELLQFIED